MTWKTSAGCGDFSTETFPPVASHRSLKARLPDTASDDGSTPIMSSTQWVTGDANSVDATSHSHAGYLAKLGGGLPKQLAKYDKEDRFHRGG